MTRPGTSRKTGTGNPKVMKKTIVSARIAVDVVEYQAYVYMNRDTKKTYNALLPGNSPTVEIEYSSSESTCTMRVFGADAQGSASPRNQFERTPCMAR